MRSRHLLAGNWKMNLGPQQAKNYAHQLRETCKDLSKTDVWIAPPDVSLPGVIEELRGSPIMVGAQNVHWADNGAFTGETSPSFLQELGCAFAIVGHSERRTYFGETSPVVAKRAVGAIAAGLTALVCIGETEAERVGDRTEAVLEEQLNPVLEALSKDTATKLVLAYEPVWAIGTGKVASLDEISQTHAFIQKVWARYSLNAPCIVLYGGSVNPSNFEAILSLQEVDGALVGGASLKADQWLELIKIAERV